MLTLSAALQALKSDRLAGQRSAETTVQRAERCIRFLGPDTAVSRVTAASARRMVLAMRETGLAPATINRYLSSLSALLEAGGGKVPELPWQREPKGRTRWLTRDEVTHLAQASLTHRHGELVASLVRFLAETGMRVGEALALTWDDVRGARAYIRTSKNGEQRVVPLTEEALAAIRSAIAASSARGGPWLGLSQSTVNHVFRAARETVASTRGDEEIVPHTLRHTCASRLTRAGVPLPVVAAWLGHRDHRSTLRYIHVDQEGLDAAMRRLQETA